MKTIDAKYVLLDVVGDSNLYSTIYDKLFINDSCKCVDYGNKPKEIVLLSLDKEDSIKVGDLVYNGYVIFECDDTNTIVNRDYLYKVLAKQSQIMEKDIDYAIEQYNTTGKFGEVKVGVIDWMDVNGNIAFGGNRYQAEFMNGFINIYYGNTEDKRIYTEEELRPLLEECLNLIGYIDTPIGRKTYSEDVVSMVKNMKSWIDKNNIMIKY